MSRVVHKKGRGLLNEVINRLPFEAHLPGYQFCGPGTKLAKRLAKGQRGINPLDAACLEHDLAYSKEKENRRGADLRLAEESWKRVKASDSNWKEKAAAWLVTTAMKSKAKFGGGNVIRKRACKKVKRGGKRKSNVKRGGGGGAIGAFRRAMLSARRALKKTPPGTGLNGQVVAALQAAKSVKALNRRRRRQHHFGARTIPVPKRGGILPFLISAIPALAALGSLAGGAASIVKTIKAGKNADERLREEQRHNQKMEEIAIGKGLYLRPYKNGMGLRIRPKNSL